MRDSGFIRTIPYRFERKYEISMADAENIANRLRHVMRFDSHANETGHYTVRSLYFDNLYNTALYEKSNGVNRRSKYRIRIYDGCTDKILLEDKQKHDNMCYKLSTLLTKEQCERLIAGEFDWLSQSDHSLLLSLYERMLRGYRPKCIIEYDRQVFICDQSNVRVTIDKNIRSTYRTKEFLLPRISGVRAPLDNWAILEVKYDHFLPIHIRNALQTGYLTQEAVSKYVLGRIYY